MTAVTAAVVEEESSAGFKKKSVSLPPELLEKAIGKATSEQRNFSSYIQRLIADDLRDEAGKGVPA